MWNLTELMNFKSQAERNGDSANRYFAFQFSPPEHQYGLFDADQGFRNPPTDETIRRAKNFYFFGRTGDGSVLALWNHDVSNPPVVYFDSEGFYRVIAASFRDFLILLAIGYEDPFNTSLLLPPVGSMPSEEGRLSWLVAHLAQQNISVPSTGAQIWTSSEPLTRLLLRQYFATVKVRADYCQVYLTNSPEFRIPEDKLPVENWRGDFLEFPEGIAFLTSDRDDLSVEVHASLRPRGWVSSMRQTYPNAYWEKTFPFVVKKDIYVSGVFEQPTTLPSHEISPGSYEVFVTYYEPFLEKSGWLPARLSLVFVPAS